MSYISLNDEQAEALAKYWRAENKWISDKNLVINSYNIKQCSEIIFQIDTDDIYKIVSNLKQNNINLFRDIMESRYVYDCEVFIEKEFLVQYPDGYFHCCIIS